MYKIRTTFNFEAAHKLNLTYDSPCSSLHGHSYKCSVTIAASQLDVNGMICDFKLLKQIINERVHSKLDHHYLNDIFTGCNSTAEFMSKWICDTINSGLIELGINAKCVRVELNETQNNQAIWEED